MMAVHCALCSTCLQYTREICYAMMAIANVRTVPPSSPLERVCGSLTSDRQRSSASLQSSIQQAHLRYRRCLHGDAMSASQRPYR